LEFFFILHKDELCTLQDILLNVNKSSKLSCDKHRGRVVEKRNAYTIFVGNTSSCSTEKDKCVKLFKINLRGMV
jgi:hypothetical protein